jgi:hypothetical protein
MVEETNKPQHQQRKNDEPFCSSDKPIVEKDKIISRNSE